MAKSKDAKSEWGGRSREKEPCQARRLPPPRCSAPCRAGCPPSRSSAPAAAPRAAPCAGCDPAAPGRGWQSRGWQGEGGRGCHHGRDALGIRQNQQYLEGGFPLGGHFGPLSLRSRCCDFCWSWKINFRGGEFQPEELAALLEALSHAPNLSIELSN